MRLNLNQTGQIALSVLDIERSEAFYERTIRPRKLYRFGDLSFFDRARVGLFPEKAHGEAHAASLSRMAFI